MVRMLAAAVMLAGCDRSYSSCGVYEEAEVTVTTSGDLPVFDWELGTAYALSVHEAGGDDFGLEMWHVQCGGDNLEDDETLEGQVCIETPIAYGDTVDSEYLDTVNTTPAQPLTPGARYVLLIHSMIEDDGPEIEPEGPEWLEFLDWESDRDDPRCGTGFFAEVEFVAPGAGPAEGEGA